MKHMKRTLCTLLSLALAACLFALPAAAADEPAWKAAYRDVINKNTDQRGAVCQLADFNLDGTPELIIGALPGTGLFSVIEHAFTFRDGAAAELSVGDKYLKLGSIDGPYSLYRNDSTGATRIEGIFVVRVDLGTSSQAAADYTLDGSVFNYKCTFVAGNEGGEKTYYIGDKAVSAAQYDSAYNSRNDGWTKLDFPVSSIRYSGKLTSAQIDELLNGYTAGPVLAQASTQSLSIDGEAVSGAAAAYNIGGSNYFKLRDLAMLLTNTGAKFEVGYDAAANQITLTTGQSYTPAGAELADGDTSSQLGSPLSSSVYIDGESVSLTGYNINGNNYFKLRDLGGALGFEVGWDEAARTVTVTTGE